MNGLAGFGFVGQRCATEGLGQQSGLMGGSSIRHQAPAAAACVNIPKEVLALVLIGGNLPSYAQAGTLDMVEIRSSSDLQIGHL